MPPRVPGPLISRKRLESSADLLQGCPLIWVQAPAGFGKTWLLTQWRREHLARGAVVAWLSAQSQDDPVRFVHGLVLAMREGAGRPQLGRELLSHPPASALQAITTWLAEVAQAAMDTVLILDEVHRLPASTVDLLVYLMSNVPSNLRVVVAAQPDLDPPIADLVDYGQCRLLGPGDLRFRLDETLALIQSRLGTRMDTDAGARLHEVVEGWPLGLQLALSAISSSTNPQATLAMLLRQGTLPEQIVGLLLANMDSADIDFLVNVSIVDELQPALCCAITGDRSADKHLARLIRDTPVIAPREQGEWLRIHQLVRDELRQRFSTQPAERQTQSHARAARWLADHGFLEAAARHALASGQTDWAYQLAERSLYKDFMTYGNQGTVLEWLDRLPPEEIERRPRLLLVAAWALGHSGRTAEGAKLVERIVSKPDITDALRCECNLILAGAAHFADDPDRCVEITGQIAHAPPLRDQSLVLAYRIHMLWREALTGNPALARLQYKDIVKDLSDSRSNTARWSEFMIGLIYLCEGQVQPAEQQLQHTLALAETDLGRRSYFTCMVAALLSAVLWELDRTTEAAVVMANRLDVLERFGTPETVILGYRTLSRIALAAGAEHRALELLDALHAVGMMRGLPSVRVTSLVEQVRVHARHFRAESCRILTAKIDELLADPHLKRGPIWWRNADALRHLADAYAAIAAHDWQQALEPLAQGEILARQQKNGCLLIEILALRALALERCGQNADALLHEAVDLANAYGLRRIFLDSHPLISEFVRHAAPDFKTTPPLAAPRTVFEQTPQPQISPSAVLTPKEREVLELLAGNLTNKEIGLAMEVSEQAIKWHIKHLFEKLNAGTRKQVVQRARLLGLLQDT